MYDYTGQSSQVKYSGTKKDKSNIFLLVTPFWDVYAPPVPQTQERRQIDVVVLNQQENIQFVD